MHAYRSGGTTYAGGWILQHWLLRNKNVIDHMDHAIGLFDIRDGHFGGIAAFIVDIDIAAFDLC
jgi:hypothetical protein